MRKYEKINDYLEILINYLFYVFIFAVGFNPLIYSFLGISSVHIIIVAIMFFFTLFLFKRSKPKESILLIPVSIYVLIVIMGIIYSLLTENIDIEFIGRVLSYRILYPVLFLMIFSNLKTSESKNQIKKIDRFGLNIIKVINFVCIIISLFGLLEQFNPSIVYGFYGGNLTSHLSIIINGEKTLRLISLVGNPINLGFYMAIGIGSSIALICINFRKSILYTVFETVCIILFMYILLLTYSRSALFVMGIIVASLIFIFLKEFPLKKKNILAIVLIFLCGFVIILITNWDTIGSRYSTINLKSYFENTRFLRVYNAFDKKNNVFQIVFGHGIRRMNSSPSYVFELGYASLLYESGLIGFFAVIACFLKGMLSGLKSIRGNLSVENICITAFYISILSGGFAGMLIEDLYMQQPFSVFLWFSTFFLASKSAGNLNAYQQEVT